MPGEQVGKYQLLNTCQSDYVTELMSTGLKNSTQFCTCGGINRVFHAALRSLIPIVKTKGVALECLKYRMACSMMKERPEAARWGGKSANNRRQGGLETSHGHPV